MGRVSYTGVAQLDASGKESKLTTPGGFTDFGSVSYSPDGTLLTGLGQTHVGYSLALWESATGQFVKALAGANGDDSDEW